MGGSALLKIVPAQFTSQVHLVLISKCLNGWCSVCSLVLYGILLTLIISFLRTSSVCSFSVEDKHKQISKVMIFKPTCFNKLRTHKIVIVLVSTSRETSQTEDLIMVVNVMLAFWSCYLSSPLCVWAPSLESHQQGWWSLQLWGEPVRGQRSSFKQATASHDKKHTFSILH